MSVSDRSRPLGRKDSAIWWPVARGLLLIVTWLSLFVLFVHWLPAILDWVSDQATHGWIVPTLVGWAVFALPALIGAGVAARTALVARQGHGRGTFERLAGRSLVAVALVPAVAFLPGRLTTTRDRWQSTVSSGGLHFHRAVQWTLLGEFVLLSVCAVVVLRRLHASPARGTWTATAILLPPPLITLTALLIAGR